ncbi:hypothetical protein [Pengzhenrongella phosphoraccumulans]|uniref:hypothetical protein n=1 Tax=Pengzhenrongella phosphoraccumulans TaxID=3114394 RepID=UPI00389093FE
MRRTLIPIALVPLLLGAMAAPALAAGGDAAGSGDVVVTNTETVQAKLDASGKLREARVYEQVALTGHGTAKVVNPVSTKNLRNLDGFGRFDVSNGDLVTTVSVDGERRLRSVSDYDKKLPLGVEVTYLLNGKVISPERVVGRSGTLDVHYKITNLTGRQQDVTYDDGTGKQVTTQAETVIPMIGQLVTTLPASFTSVTSGEAGIAGDGHGGTRMTYQMTLFPPIGAPTIEFGYTAQVSDAVVPSASITSLPVSPLTYPSFKGGSASYQAGATSGVSLTSGAIEIDANLLKLRDGAAQLLDGLVQLRAGADKLSTGLTDDAVPGANQLATGAGLAKSGADKLAAGAVSAQSGATQLAAGATAAQVGATQLTAGSTQLADGLASAGSKAPALLGGLKLVDGGLADIDAGLTQLSGAIGTLPAQSDPLHAGIAKMRTSISTQLLPGVTLLHSKLLEAATGAGGLAAAVDGTSAQVACAADKLTQLANGSGGAGGSCDAAAGIPATDPLVAAELVKVITSLRTSQFTLANPTAGSPSINASLVGLQGSLGALAAGSQAVMCGISVASSPSCPTTDANGAPVLGLLEGINQIDGGITLLVTSTVGKVQGAVGGATDTKKQGTLRGGIHSVQAGTGEIAAGGTTLVTGLGQLSSGAVALRAGAGKLTDGTGQLATGAGALAAGTGQLATGAGSLAEGNGKIAIGAGSLARGLRDAADGSELLAAGLGTAATSAPGLVDGAQRLSTEGTSKLVTSGEATAADYGVKYAVIAAGADRAATEGMAYGAPDGAAGATAYSIDIAGADDAGVNSAGRGLAAVALFAGGAGLAGLVRRRLT